MISAINGYGPVKRLDWWARGRRGVAQCACGAILDRNWFGLLIHIRPDRKRHASYERGWTERV